MNRHAEATRKTFVIGVSITCIQPGDALFPSKVFAENEEPGDVWLVSVQMRTGLLRESTRLFYCYSEEEANDKAAHYAIGSEVDDWSEPEILKSEENRRAILQSIFDSGVSPGTGAAGDEHSPLAISILEEAGVYDGNQVSQTVLDYLGEQRVDHLTSRHGENWQVAAAFEYCFISLPPSSPASIAAVYQYHQYVSGDEFAAGYYWRDLEFAAAGVEAEAVKALETRKKAGEKGREASSKARTRRIASLLTGIETTARRNPDIVKLPKALVALGLEEATKADPKLWKQGRGQIDEYLGEMRRGEAGKEVQARYLALLPVRTA